MLWKPPYYKVIIEVSEQQVWSEQARDPIALTALQFGKPLKVQQTQTFGQTPK